MFYDSVAVRSCLYSTRSFVSILSKSSLFVYSVRYLAITTMYSTRSFWVIALAITSQLALILGARLPVDEVYRREHLMAKENLTKRDLQCVENDVLLSLQQYTDDSVPFCSSYIGIPQETSISTLTTKTLSTLTSKLERRWLNEFVALSLLSPRPLSPQVWRQQWLAAQSRSPSPKPQPSQFSSVKRKTSFQRSSTSMRVRLA